MKYYLLVLFICCVAFSCTSKTKTPGLKLETLSDSLYHADSNYLKDIAQWKNYYKGCVNADLFPNAYYLQLQDKIYISSINNEHEVDVNKGIHLLDTAKMSDIFNLLYVTNGSNCSDTLHLTNTLKKAFLKEIKNILNSSPEYKTVLDLIDTTTIKIRIGTVYTDELMHDRLINLLDTTKDESLLKYKTLLMNSENVLLAKTVEVLGFNAEFSLNKQPYATQAKQLSDGVSFKLNSANDNASVTVANNNLRMQVNKRYTVLGSFVQLKAE